MYSPPLSASSASVNQDLLTLKGQAGYFGLRPTFCSPRLQSTGHLLQWKVTTTDRRHRMVDAGLSLASAHRDCFARRSHQRFRCKPNTWCTQGPASLVEIYKPDPEEKPKNMQANGKRPKARAGMFVRRSGIRENTRSSQLQLKPFCSRRLIASTQIKLFLPLMPLPDCWPDSINLNH